MTVDSDGNWMKKTNESEQVRQLDSYGAHSLVCLYCFLFLF